MRIAILSTPFIRVPPVGYGGTELFCYELAEELSARGHAVTLYTTGDSSTSCDKRWLYDKAEWPPSREDEANHAAWALGDIARERFDVAHLNSPIAVAMSNLVDVPFVYTVHHHREPPMSRVYAAHPGVAYVAISERQRALETGIQGATVIHHGLSPERYPESDHDGGYLLHLGRYAEQKGTHVAIDIALAAGLPLKLAGRTHPDDVAYFRDEVAPRLGVRRIEEVGEANHDVKVALLRGARALVCPLAWEEPFGLVAIEAMLTGTPVLGFARGSFPEIVDEGVTGFLAPPGDAAALARIASRLGGFDRRACAARARARFSTSAMTDAYERLYASVAKRSRIANDVTAPAPRRRSSAGT